MAKKKTKKQEIDLSGSEFFVTEAEKRLLGVHVKRREAAEMGLEYFSGALDAARRGFWELLFELYPEWKEYHFNYNSTEGKIELIRKKPIIKK